MSFLALDELKMEELNRKIHNDPVAFADLILGIWLHKGQRKWIKNGTKRINILRPGNRFGKTLSEAVKHTHECMCKPKLDDKVLTHEEWFRVEYNTLNFGPTYELGRGALLLARDLIQGNVIIKVCPKCDSHRIEKTTLKEEDYVCVDCDHHFQNPSSRTNKSMLKDWAITEDRADSAQLPYLGFKTGANMLGRSMSELGVAFKMRKLAFISGDECSDVPELWTFVNNTLLMRVVDMNGNIDLVGTPQPDGHDYMRIIELAEEDMKLPGWEKEGMYYTQRGSIYENQNLPSEAIREIERISDPEYREQIINGEFVEAGNKYFGFERIQNAVDKDIELIEYGLPDRKYATAVDFAGGESVWADFTVIMTVDYTEEPYKIVGFQRFKGGEVAIPMQYELVRETVGKFNSKLIIDSSALGGKNALAFLSDLQPISQEFGPSHTSTHKSNMLATLKIAFDGGQSTKMRRERIRLDSGEWIEKNPQWGLIRLPNIPALIGELQNYKADDDKIRNDSTMTLAMAIHWIEMRRPKNQPRRAVDIDFYS